MAEFVKGLFGGQKPVVAPVSGDDGTYASTNPKPANATATNVELEQLAQDVAF
jgi:hypothetical protein